MTELDTRPIDNPALDTGDDEPKNSHYVKKEDIMRSALDGTPAVALCGKTWMPNRDPEKYPICPKCVELMEMLRSMD
ncbi:MAG: hypothetical protein JWN57_53 [Frankiales bacterium]|jgi:hypothetical protein|nr:hypothetical protein [Frankiales bacterium]